MTIPLTVATPLDLGVNDSGSVNCGASPNGVVVVVMQHGNSRDCTAVTYAGQAMALQSEAFLSSIFSYRVQTWFLAGGSLPGGSQTLALTSDEAFVQAYGVVTSGTATVADTDSADAVSGISAVTMDTGSVPGLLIMGASTKNPHTAGANTTIDGYDSKANVYRVGAHETTQQSGSRSISVGGTYGAVAGVAIIGSDLELTPDPVGMTIGLNAGTIGGSGDANIEPDRLRGLVIGLRAGRLGATQKRQVALVGPDAETYRFTPEMTEDGDEGDVLVQHAAEPPTWESTADLPLRKWREPVRFDTDGDGVADAFLFSDDGDVVMIEKVGT